MAPSYINIGQLLHGMVIEKRLYATIIYKCIDVEHHDPSWSIPGAQCSPSWVAVEEPNNSASLWTSANFFSMPISYMNQVELVEN